MDKWPRVQHVAAILNLLNIFTSAVTSANGGIWVVSGLLIWVGLFVVIYTYICINKRCSFHCANEKLVHFSLTQLFVPPRCFARCIARLHRGLIINVSSAEGRQLSACHRKVNVWLILLCNRCTEIQCSSFSQTVTGYSPRCGFPSRALRRQNDLSF